MADHDMPPYAGNPFVRFDEEEVASATLRRGGLFRACGVCGVTLAAALASGVCRAENATIAELNLVQDVTIDVASVSTTDVERVTGGAFTIIKIGGGVVRFGFIQNTKAKLVIAGGHEEFYVPDASELLDEADLHFDANDMHNDGYVELLNGTNFITCWYQSSHPERALYAKHDDYAPACRPGLFSDAPAGDYPPLVNYWQNTVYAYQSARRAAAIALPLAVTDYIVLSPTDL